MSFVLAKQQIHSNFVLALWSTSGENANCMPIIRDEFRTFGVSLGFLMIVLWKLSKAFVSWRTAEELYEDLLVVRPNNTPSLDVSGSLLLQAHVEKCFRTCFHIS